jgi:hypothetical protein
LVNAAEFRFSRSAVLLLAALVLTAAAWLRGAEYDEQYTLFLTAGTPRPDWPETVFPASAVAAMQSGHATLAGIARDLRATDVHPPLYFWAVSLWRQAFGPSLFAARMLSVACGVASLGLVGVIARRCLIPPVLAMLLCLGCYSFVYTNAIARGFAPAQLLTLCGIALLLGRRPMLAGISLGAACCCNYLAVFVAAAAIIGTGAWVAVPAAVPFLVLDAWFFAAQHAARSGQFVPFAVGPSLVRLAEYQAATVFGGLPLYVNGSGRIAAEAVIGLVSVTLVLCIARARLLQAGGTIRLMALAAAAPPVGLLVLGAAFDNTPIELRYLSFGAPFIALVIAWALNAPVRTAFTARMMVPLVLSLQFAGIAGLLLSPRTMQPASGAAIAATSLAGDAIVLVPRGNDGVGIVGAFGIAAPPALPILLIRPTDAIADLIAPYHRVAVAALAQDRDSTKTVSLLRAALAAPNWRLVANGSNLEVYQRADQKE